MASSPFSRFQTLFEQGKVGEVAIAQGRIHGTLKATESDVNMEFVTTRVDPQFAAQFDRQRVAHSGVIERALWRDALSWILPTVSVVAIEQFRCCISRSTGSIHSPESLG